MNKRSEKLRIATQQTASQPFTVLSSKSFLSLSLMSLPFSLSFDDQIEISLRISRLADRQLFFVDRCAIQVNTNDYVASKPAKQKGIQIRLFCNELFEIDH